MKGHSYIEYANNQLRSYEKEMQQVDLSFDMSMTASLKKKKNETSIIRDPQ